nr:UDP-glycosyltransferase 83A1-like [Tanacetum cinerariifolium]
MARPRVRVISYPAQGHVIPTMELAQRLVEQGEKITFINTEVNHKLLTSNQVDKDGFMDLMQMVSIPDRLEPWEDRSDVTKEKLVAGQDEKKKELEQEYSLIPICTTSLFISQDAKDSADDAGKKAPKVD